MRATDDGPAVDRSFPESQAAERIHGLDLLERSAALFVRAVPTFIDLPGTRRSGGAG
jgi:hypothetical protein